MKTRIKDNGVEPPTFTITDDNNTTVELSIRQAAIAANELQDMIRAILPPPIPR